MLYSEIITKFKLINASPCIVIISFYNVRESILCIFLVFSTALTVVPMLHIYLWSYSSYKLQPCSL